MPTIRKANTLAGVPLVRNSGMASPSTRMAAVTQIKKRRRPILSARTPEKLMAAPKTTAEIIRKPVKVLAGSPSPCGWPKSESVAGVLK